MASLEHKAKYFLGPWETLLNKARSQDLDIEVNMTFQMVASALSEFTSSSLKIKEKSYAEPRTQRQTLELYQGLIRLRNVVNK